MPTAKSKKASPKGEAEKNELSEPKPALMELFTDGIKDIYWAENHLAKALPKMQMAATSQELANAIADHLEVTRTHVTRLEEIFTMLGKDPQAKKCQGMDGLTKEGEEVIEATEDGSATRDAGIVMASQKVEHYEISTYASLAKLANILGLADVEEMLNLTLAEEVEADQKLAAIADNSINNDAAAEA